MPGVYQYTVQYRSFLKRAAKQAMEKAFTSHPDPTVNRTQVALDFGNGDFSLPAVIVKFNEQTLPNAGVGHYEWWPLLEDPDQFVEMQHRLYKGSIQFDVYARDSLDRDLVADALIETLAMDEVSAPGLAFITHFYNEVQGAAAPGIYHFPTLNTGLITPVPEQATPPPWGGEDTLVYQLGYQVPVMGEFYSYVPPSPKSTGPISEVDVYEWPVDQDGNALDPTNPAPPVDPDQYQKYTGFRPGSKTVPTG